MRSITLTSIVSAVSFVALLIVLHLVDNTIDPNWQPISEYSLMRFGFLMRLAFIGLGISMVTIALALWISIPSIGSRIAAAMIVLAGLGNFLAAIFNTDPSGTLPDQMTLNGQVHAGAAGLLGFFVLATPIVSWQFFRNKQFKRFSMPVLLSTCVLWIAELILVIAMGYYLSSTNGMISSETPFGWHARFLLLACVAWLIVTSVQLQRGSTPLSDSPN